MRAKSLVAIIFWLVLVSAGFSWLAIHESRPGAAADGAHVWPADSVLARNPDRWNLVLFLHPRCPCSKATLDQLSELLERYAGQLQTYVIFCKPPGTPEGWEKSATWRQATSMPGVTVCTDADDSERRRFGALTSGQVFLFDGRDGRVCYRGGITRARGMVGSSTGGQAIESFLSGQPVSVREGPVFGCPLIDPEP